MTIFIEVTVGHDQRGSLGEKFKQLLREKVGISMNIDLVDPGTLTSRTGLEARQKAIRLIDLRTFDTSGR